MKILIACEMSGRVREAFRKKGHEAYSCDLLDSLDASPYHIKGDVLEILGQGWDLIVAHPPCTHLTVAGNRWYSDKLDLIQEAADFAKIFMNHSDKVCIENPVGRLSTFWRKPDQYIQPWMFGHRETKRTGLWLKNLPRLKPTNIVEDPYEQRIWKMGPSKDRAMLRSLTYQGIADAMAEQWS